MVLNISWGGGGGGGGQKFCETWTVTETLVTIRAYKYNSMTYVVVGVA